MCVFFFKQKTAYEMRISDWSSDVCSSDLGSINPNLSYASGANYNKIDNYGINGQIEYELSNELTAKSITSYRRLDSKFGVDIGGAPFAALNPHFADRENQLSQELQPVGKTYQDCWKDRQRSGKGQSGSIT